MVTDDQGQGLAVRSLAVRSLAVLMEEAAIVKPILSLIALMEGMVLKILGETIVDKALLVDQKQSPRMHRYWKTEKGTA